MKKHLLLLLPILLLFVFVIGFKAQAQADPDAIAVRILPNPNNYDIQQWYNLQGFTGSPQAMIVDGWKAIRNGRTVYISAANVDEASDRVYFNIYVISYNQDADNSTVDIFGRILQNWKLNSNLKEYIGSCSVSNIICSNNSDCPSGYLCGNNALIGEAYQENKCIIAEDDDDYTTLINTPSCILDSECPSNLFCDSFQASLIRDVDRMGKLNSIETRLENYRNTNNNYPILNSGTYIPHIAISTWPSWQSIFLNQIESPSMVDPINRLGSCYDQNASFDLLTCWNANLSLFARADSSINYLNFALPRFSKTFSYVSNPEGSDYDLYTNFETLLHNSTNLIWPNERDSMSYLSNLLDDSSVALILNKNISIAGSVTSSPEGINCGDSCNLTSFTYPTGETITLTATANDGYTFTSWQGGPCDGSTSTTCQLTLNELTEVTAEFNVPSHNFSLLTHDNGSIFCNDASCSDTYYEGTNISITNTPDTGYDFIEWIGDYCSGTSDTCSLTIDGDKSVGAIFSPIMFNLNLSSTNGGILCDGGTCDSAYPHGSSIELTPDPDAGYSFDSWTGACSGTSGSCNLNIDSEMTVGANFSVSDLNLSLSSVNGDILCDGGVCAATYPYGSSVELTPDPDTGHGFDSWTGDCLYRGVIPVCDLLIDGDKSVGANFSPANFNLSLSSTNGDILCDGGACSSTYPYGSSIDLTAVPNTGYSFDDWTGDCSSYGTSTTCSLTIDGEMTVGANFSSSEFNLSLSSTNGDILCNGGACSSTYSYGSSVLLTVNPDTDYRFDGWTGDCSGVSSACDLIIDSNKSVGANFLLLRGTFTDSRDGTEYDWIRIGDQAWMAENLKYLPSVSPSSTISENDPFYYVYDYNGTDVVAAKATTNYQTYGVLYNYSAALSICPSGWHLPSDAEFRTLEEELGMCTGTATGCSYSYQLRGTNEGSKLAGEYNLWNDGVLRNNVDFGSSGFNALPAGRTGFSGFIYINSYASFWTSSSSISRSIKYNVSGIYRVITDKDVGFSVRCIKD